MDPEKAEQTLRALREQVKPLLLEVNALLGELDKAEQRIAQDRRTLISLHDQLDDILDSER